MCDERDQLVEYVYDEADPAGRARFEAHLASCDRCREELTEFRQVRTKLLAWDVPDHGSVWTPFVSARALPWYRQVPTWALAAAASLMLVVGGLGGFAAHSWLTSPKTVASVASGAQDVTVAEFSALEQRIVAIETAQEKQQVAIAHAVSAANVSAPPAPIDVIDQKTIEDVRAENKENAASLINLNNDLVKIKRQSDSHLRWLSDRLGRLESAVAAQQAQQPGGGF
jgi:hypothetical protein